MARDLYFSDCEVFSHDWLFVFKRQRDGQTFAIWNDNEEVSDFVNLMNPVLCGFNFRDYDSYILKAILLGWGPEHIKTVNDTIIFNDDRQHTWALFQDSPWVTLPPIIDLYHDVVPRKGLKEIEANIGRPIVESSVSFDIDRPLTPEEREEVERYCVHDVDATAALYDLRFDYLKAKSDLCETRGVDPLTMLKHTNARVVSEILQAERLPVTLTHDPDDRYEIPECIDVTAIPEDVKNYVLGIRADNCEADHGSIEFMFHDCPTIVGLGGIHAAVPSYKETASDERVILLQDIGSFYPSLILNHGYMSLAVPDASVYREFYDMRMAAKAAGDKATAEAAKLVLNTTFGTMKDTYNKMYDPMQNTRVCLTGQLHILDLIEQMYRAVPEGLQLIQLNTDGWVISAPRVILDTLNNVVSQWQERTNLTVDTDEVEVIVQANVNNYVLRTADGKVKAKGGVVARHAGGDFKSNSMTIIDKAVVDYLLDGTPIADTVNACDDIERFQIIAKAGRTFQKVVHQVYDDALFEYVDVTVQRVNRAYAVLDDDPGFRQDGGIFKVKMQDGKEVSRSKVPLTPPHCVIDNDNALKDSGKLLTQLDRSWYIALAQKKTKEFVTRNKKEREQMVTVDETTNEVEAKPKPTPRKKAPKNEEKAPETPTPPPFTEKMFQLHRAMSDAAKGVRFDSVVSNIGYEYADTQQYKAWFAAACASLRLIPKLDISSEWLGVVSPETKTPTYGVKVVGRLMLLDADSDKAEIFDISGIGINVQAGYCEGAAQTNALRNFILNNFQLDNKGRDGDDVALAAEEATVKQGYVSPEKKADIKKGIAAEKGKDAQFATDLFAVAVYERIMEARKYQADFAEKTLATHYEDGKPKMVDGRPTLKKLTAQKAMTQADEIIAKNEGGGDD